MGLLDEIKSPLLECLLPEEKESVLEVCKIKQFSEGESIIERDDIDTSVFFILEGCVHVLNYSVSGRAITYSTLNRGDIFGELAAIDRSNRAAWILAVTECRVIQFSGELFMSLVEGNAQFAVTLLRKLSANLRESNERLTDIFSLGAEQRACLELIRMAKPDPLKPDCYLVQQMPTQANFANLIGSSRETVSRIMSRLKSDEIISNSSKGLQILDRKQLEKRAFS